jgi:hypothetical protein
MGQLPHLFAIARKTKAPGQWRGLSRRLLVSVFLVVVTVTVVVVVVVVVVVSLLGRLVDNRGLVAVALSVNRRSGIFSAASTVKVFGCSIIRSLTIAASLLGAMPQ